MRPSFHCARAWPFSAAYCREVISFSVSSTLGACVPPRNASCGDRLLLGELPSNPPDGPAPKTRPTARALTRALDIRIGRFLALAAGMRHRTVQRRSHLLGVFPQGPRA